MVLQGWGFTTGIIVIKLEKMETVNFEFELLTQTELENIDGGMLGTLVAAAALWGALYAAGYACGQAYYHYTH